MRIAFVLVALLLASLLAIGLYWQHRLAPILEAKGVDVFPTALTLSPPPAVRHVDLGFVSFAIPERIKGELVQHEESLFVTVAEANSSESGLTICPLVSEDDPEFAQVLRHFEELTGEPVSTYWELRKRMLHTQPFSVWSMPIRGFRRTVADLALLVLKALDCGGADEIWIHEDADVAITLTQRDGMNFIQLHEKRSRSGQQFMLRTGLVDPRDIVAALAASYRVNTTEFDEETLRTKLRATGIRQFFSSSGDTTSATTPLDEAERLSRIADEIRARRERRDTKAGSTPMR